MRSVVLKVDEIRGPHGGRDSWSSWWMRSVVLTVDEIHGPHGG